MDQKIIDLYDDYVHRHFDRRLFLDRLSGLAGGMGAALALLPLLQSNYALAETVKAGDPRIRASRVAFEGVSGPVRAYL
ncbi:MAG TPA: dienelactone hydrolase family protein, partial [Rhizomicrobium sp.]